MEITLSIDCARELLKALGLELEVPGGWKVTDKGVVMPITALAQELYVGWTKIPQPIAGMIDYGQAERERAMQLWGHRRLETLASDRADKEVYSGHSRIPSEIPYEVK